MIRPKLKTRLARTIAGVALVGVMIATPLVASANTFSIGATGESFNQTLYYSATRYHGTGTIANFALQSHSGMCASQFKLALRNQGTGDSTYYTYWSAPGGAQTFQWYTGAYSIPSGNYSVTARNDCAGMPGATYNWAGSLNL